MRRLFRIAWSCPKPSSSAIETAVNASISTPVCALVLTVAVADTVHLSETFTSTSTLVNGNG